MITFPSRFRRLDDALADLPGDEPMLLTELDGYLTGIVVCPEPILAGEWLPRIWGDLGDAAPFDDPADVRLFADMVMARHDEILRDLRRGKLQPIFDIDERNGEVLWESWIEGFAMAMEMRADGWAGVAPGEDGASEALAYLTMLVQVARNETSLMSDEINAICDEAPGMIPGQVMRLFAWRIAHGVAPAAPEAPAGKIGRNDACPCGSGRKYKKCCGSN